MRPLYALCMKFLIFILSFFSLPVFANNCTEYNLLETHSELSQMSVKNQGSFSTCYAHSLSALYQVKTGRALHPYSIAFEHKKRFLHWTPYNLNYSLASFAWSDVRKKGVCYYADISKRLDEYRTNNHYNDDQVIYAIKAFYPHKNIARAISDLKNDPFQDGHPWQEDDLQELFTLVSHHPQKKFFDFLEEVILKDCVKEFPRLELKSTGLGFQTNESLQKVFERNLASGEISVMGYCSRHMEEANYYQVKPRALLSIMPNCGAHYVVLVGQKEINNKCQVLIKNSHGNHFWGRDDQSCLCKGNFGFRICEKANFDLEQEEVVGCYYDRELFLNETFDVSYF